MRHKRRKGVTEIVAASVLIVVTVGAAGTYYTQQENILQSVEEPELHEEIPIRAEACSSNFTHTKITIRNLDSEKKLDPNAIRLYNEGNIITNTVNGTAAPGETTTIRTENHFPENTVLTVKTPIDETPANCGINYPDLVTDYKYTPENPVKGNQITLTEKTEGYVRKKTWYLGGTKMGTGDTVKKTINTPGEYDFTLQATDVLNKTENQTKKIRILEPAYIQIRRTTNNSPVVEEDKFQQNYSVENTGEATDTQNLELQVEGTTEDTKTVTLTGGNTKTGKLEWKTQTGDAGTHNYKLTTEDTQDSGIATVLAPANYQIMGTSDNSPVEAGNNFKVDYQLENTGEEEVTKNIELQIDGTTEETNSHTLKGGETTSDTLTWSTDTGDIGDHNWKVATEDDQERGSVTVEDPKVLEADFSYSPNNPRVSDTIDFSDNSNIEDTTVSERRWDFGDGNTATGSNPSHSYSSSGTYTVELEIEDEDGDTDTKTKTMDVFSCDNVFPVGSGTDSDPYEISNVNELQDIQKCPDKVFEIVSNIDASGTSSWNSGKGFNPIQDFTGKLWAQGYNLNDLYIDRSTEYVGLFANPSGGEITGLTMLNAKIYNSGGIGDGRRVGVLAGEIESGVYVKNVKVSGEIECTCGDGATQAGGFIAYIKGDVYNSESDVSVKGGANRVGGFASQISGNVKNSISRGNVENTNSGILSSSAGGFAAGISGEVYDSEAYGDVSGGRRVGGFVGDNSFANSGSLIENSKAYGDVDGELAVGGFAGEAGGNIGPRASSKDIYDSEAYGDVTGDERVGGFVGDFRRDDNEIGNSHAEGMVNGNNAVGGFAGKVGDENMGSSEHLKILGSTWDSSATGQSDEIGVLKEGDGDVTVELTDTS